MVDVTVTVEEYADIQNEGATLSDRDTIARCLQTADQHQLVAFVPRWLRDEKDVDAVICQPIEHETEKAYLVEVSGRDVWLPKSVITRFVATTDATIRIPQRGLSEFAGGETA